MGHFDEGVDVLATLEHAHVHPAGHDRVPGIQGVDDREGSEPGAAVAEV